MAVLLAAVVCLSQSSSALSSSSYQGLFFTVPAGWTTSTQQGRFIVEPANAPTGVAVFINLYGRERLSSPLDDWLFAKMKADFGSTLKVPSSR